MGVDKGILSALLDHEEKIMGPHFIFSLENISHPRQNELNLSHNQVLDHLYNAGYDAHGITGHQGTKQKYIIIYGVLPDQAEELHQLAAKLGQDSSIYSDGNVNEMRFHHGTNSGRSHYGQGVKKYDNAPKKNFYSLPGNMTHIDHNFDRNSYHLSGQMNKMASHGR